MELRSLLKGVGSYSKMLVVASTGSIVFPLIALSVAGADPLNALVPEILATFAGIIAFVAVSQISKSQPQNRSANFFLHDNFHIIGSLTLSFFAVLVFWVLARETNDPTRPASVLLLCLANALVCYGLARLWVAEELWRDGHQTDDTSEFGRIDLSSLKLISHTYEYESENFFDAPLSIAPVLHTGIAHVLTLSLEELSRDDYIRKFRVSRYLIAGTSFRAFTKNRRKVEVSRLFGQFSINPKNIHYHNIVSIFLTKPCSGNEIDRLKEISETFSVGYKPNFVSYRPVEIVQLNPPKHGWIDEDEISAMNFFSHSISE